MAPTEVFTAASLERKDARLPVAEVDVVRGARVSGFQARDLA